MIKANELRIGNLVNTKYGILSVHASMLADIVNNGFNVNPIPLTPEILESCGFTKDEEELCLPVDDNYSLVWDEDGVYIDSFESLLYDSRIIYLHQLQNLYFALKGEELEVKLLDRVSH